MAVKAKKSAKKAVKKSVKKPAAKKAAKKAVKKPVAKKAVETKHVEKTSAGQKGFFENLLKKLGI